ncbi:flavoprotein [Streptomyces sp. CB02923]|uniref:flavoprotein n=1 Tax=Streptomyces sp. CB02923 TaxID=1718985 RepID=UPI00093CBCD1|nr:flavoprotein [Streptomyces sp. CB02923]OKI08257.1 flavoprotein [Streptomyces sp. CB02923]
MSTPRVLYIIACAAGPASQLVRLVEAAVADGWEVCVIATPAAEAGAFIDVPAVEAASGRPVRSDWRRAGEAKRNPPPDAVIVAPMTMNSVNKWAAGIADTYALGLLTEAVGLGLPVVALPFWSTALDAHPATRRSVRVLCDLGVRVLYGPGSWEPHAPGTGGDQLDRYPWRLALETVEELAGSGP